MQWIEISLACERHEVEGIAGILARYGQGGAVTEQRATQGLSDEHYLIRIYLPMGRSHRLLKRQIEYDLFLAGYGHPLQQKVLKQDEWFDSLRKNFKMVQIGSRFVVKPSWETQELDYPGRVIIEMDPGAAFGTGLHPTTRLCLLNLDQYLKPGMAVFDLGTGTGILAIAAVKLGAASVLALDIDSVAVKAAQSNARANQVKTAIQFKKGTLSRVVQNQYRCAFDVVLANITSRAIADLSLALEDVLKPQGILIVSGIHPEGLDEVLIRLTLANLKLIHIEVEQGWHAVIARKIGLKD